MKKLMLAICVMMLLLLVACSSQKETEESDYGISEEVDISNFNESIYTISEQSIDIIVKIEEEIVTFDTNKVTLIITNTSENQYMYGREQHLEMEIEGEWYVVSEIHHKMYDLDGIGLSPNSTQRQDFDIGVYDKLVIGKYRVIKTLIPSSGGINDEIFAVAEFNVQ